MNRYLVLYNPLSSKGKGKENVEHLKDLYPDAQIEFKDATKEDIPKLLQELPEDVTVIFTGGDGTVNRMLNIMADHKITRTVCYYPAGTGNDFINDLNLNGLSEPFAINEYLEGMPTVTVKGITCKFINGIGYGLDGYCCEESDRLKALGKSKSYTVIAAEGVLYKYKPTNATVTVDGETRRYKKVFMAPAMFGRFFGGGVNIAPHQDRKNPDHSVTSVVVHGISRIHALLIFLQITAGKGDKFPKYLDYRVGHDVKVTFDRPTALQIDGETVLGVTEYEVHAEKSKKC